jgi:methylase of polypeptide subunit release factors
MSHTSIPKITKRTIQEHKLQTQTVKYSYLDKSFRILPGTFNPQIAASGIVGRLFCSLPIFKGKNFLEIGSGSGIWCCLVALAGAKTVTGVDTNYSAITSAQENAKLHRVDKITHFFNQDIRAWKPSKKYDIAYADLPFVDSSPKGSLESAFLDNGVSGILTTLEKVKNYLKTGGDLYLCLGSISPLEKIRKHAQKNGWTWFRLLTIKHQGISLYLYKLTRKVDFKE